MIYACDRDAAAITVVNSNLHWEHILPSEKAFACKLKMEALSHQGKRTDLTGISPPEQRPCSLQAARSLCYVRCIRKQIPVIRFDEFPAPRTV